MWARTEKVSVPLVQTVPVNLQKKTVLVEIDTWTRKQKANEKNNPCRSSKKVLSKRIPNPLKLSIQGHPGEMRQAGLRDGRQPRCPGPSLGNGPRSLPKEKSRSSRRRILCSYLHASTRTISEHNPKFPARKKLLDCLPVIRSLFFLLHHWNKPRTRPNPCWYGDDGISGKSRRHHINKGWAWFEATRALEPMVRVLSNHGW